MPATMFERGRRDYDRYEALNGSVPRGAAGAGLKMLQGNAMSLTWIVILVFAAIAILVYSAAIVVHDVLRYRVLVRKARRRTRRRCEGRRKRLAIQGFEGV